MSCFPFSPHRNQFWGLRLSLLTPGIEELTQLVFSLDRWGCGGGGGGGGVGRTVRLKSWRPAIKPRCPHGSPPLSQVNRLVVKASASRAEDPGFGSRLRRDFFRSRVTPVTSKLALQLLPCQAPGVIGSVLGLDGPVSVYFDWVRWNV